MRQMPHQEIRNRAVIDGVTQLLRTDAPLHPQTDFSLERSIQDVPGFGFAVRQSGRLRIGIIRMNLDGKWLTRKQKLQQKRGRNGCRIGALVPDLTDRIGAVACAAPRTRIYNTPRLW